MWISWVTEENCTSVVLLSPENDASVRLNGPPPVRYEVHAGILPHRTYMEALPYRSNFIHQVLLSGLRPESHYSYRVGGGPLRHDERSETFSRAHKFSTLASPGTGGPMRVAVVGDVGDTAHSRQTLLEANLSSSFDKSAMGHIPNQFLALAGDLSYADGNGSKWDIWGDMMSPVLQQLPLIAIPGNHEIEIDRVSRDAFVHYRSRYRMPEVSPEQTAPGKIFNQDTYDFDFTYEFGSSYYSFDVGLCHFVCINTYAHSEVGSIQWAWLEQDLNKIDRSVTPWVIAFGHGPWYNSNRAHHNEKATTSSRKSLEPLLLSHQVAAYFAGHVHAYERTHPMSFGSLNPRGVTHITIGDGGNSEGLENNWIDPPPSWCD